MHVAVLEVSTRRGGVLFGGDWRLTLSSDLDIEVLSYVRTPADGFVTSMHDLVQPDEHGSHRVATFNPGEGAHGWHGRWCGGLAAGADERP